MERWKLSPAYLAMAARYWWFRLRNPHVVTHGMVYMDRDVDLYCRRGLGYLEIGRGVWIGRGTAIRCHEGYLRIGDGVVFGGRDTVNCYLDVEIDDECLFADEVYVVDFDHRYDDPGATVQSQGIVKSPVRLGRDCWIGTKAVLLRGVSLGEGCVVGAAAVVRGRFEDRSVIVGSPARAVKRRG